jgi:hypothetical protein
MPKPYTREEMNVLADLVMDERGPIDWEKLVEGTGWTADAFRALADYRWNGPAWVR